MRKFDLEAAKRGEPICTSEGHEIRILIWDLKNLYPIVVALLIGDEEVIATYTLEGRHDKDKVSDMDLVMAPCERVGYINPELLWDNPKEGYIEVRWIG